MIFKWPLGICYNNDEELLQSDGKILPVNIIQAVGHFEVAVGGQFSIVTKQEKVARASHTNHDNKYESMTRMLQLLVIQIFYDFDKFFY